MNPETLNRCAIEPALSLLPRKMDSKEARHMLVAIAVQESGLRHRRQVKGPARGWWQFEVNGVIGVVAHHATSRYAAEACNDLGYEDASPRELYEAMEHNDVLAAVFARLNLYWLPQALPDSAQEGWLQYKTAWNPGKPHPERWIESWQAV